LITSPTLYRYTAKSLKCVLVVYLADDDSPSEPDFQYIPDTPSLASVGGDPLTASMTLLKDGLDTGTTVAQFEVCHQLL